MDESADIEIIGIVNALKRLFPRDTRDNMIVGTVVKTEPLKIDIGQGVVLTEEFLYLGQMCRPWKVTIPHKHLIDSFLTEKTKAINTTGISAGISTDVAQTTGQYDVKTQEIEYDDEQGTTKRTLNTETKSNVDLGGATLKMKIDVATSTVQAGAYSGTVIKTTDLSTFTPKDDGHIHIITEKQTQDVHFAGTEYEESVEMEIYPRLAPNDKVLMFAMNNFQMWYVAERISYVKKKT